MPARQLQAEQAQDGPAQRVDPDRRGAREAITTPTISPVTSGRITQSRAGGVNGFSTSQLAGSRSTIGAPPAIASRHASSSKDSSARGASPT